MESRVTSNGDISGNRRHIPKAPPAVGRETAPWYAGKAVNAVRRRIRIDGRSFDLPPTTSTFLGGLACLGVYETVRAIRRCTVPAPRTLPVVELGGSAGIVACLTNSLLLDPTRHIVVEANPNLVPILERNRQTNGCQFGISACRRGVWRRVN